MNFIVVIPARFASSRLPSKALIDINGKPMVVRVMEKAQASGANRVIVATDHVSIIKVVRQAGGEACLTSPTHQSGTERIREVVDKYKLPSNQIVVNVQGDEPLIPSILINQVADNLTKVNASMTTLATPINTIEEAFDPNLVKVVVNSRSYALYFSRATIPWNYTEFSKHRQHLNYKMLRHIGIYAYYADFIRNYTRLAVSSLEYVESLEQLRVLWHGEKIHVAVSNTVPGIGVDTLNDLAQVRFLQQQQDNE